jgi:hypothetical protein
MQASQLLELVYSLLVVAGFIAGLYLACKILPAAFAVIQPRTLQPVFPPLPFRIALVLALGAVLALPLLDLLGLARIVIELLTTSIWHEIWTSPWGTAPAGVYELLMALVIIASYVFSFWAVRRRTLAWLLPESTPRTARVWRLLAPLPLGALIASFAKTVIIEITWLPLPLGNPTDRGAVGFATSWALGVAVFALLVLWAAGRVSYLNETYEETR